MGPEPEDFGLDHVNRKDLKLASSVEVLAIDGPVLSDLRDDSRPCEKVFVWAPFQRRCKPGETSGKSRLRQEGCEIADQFAEKVSGSRCGAEFPRVLLGTNVVEAFPNTFLGVMLPESNFLNAPKLKRGKKFDWLFNKSLGTWDRLRGLVEWECAKLWEALETNADHEERAALICVLTAVCVLRGKYVAVGEPEGGYFFLPPWSAWEDWAKCGLRRNREDSRLSRRIEVWIDGRRFSHCDALPA